MERFQTPHPFALERLLVDGHHLLKELGDETLLELGSGGQTTFEKVIAPFCRRLNFDETTNLASRFYPNGEESEVVIDPHQTFRRPVISGTSITTEVPAYLIRGVRRSRMWRRTFDSNLSRWRKLGRLSGVWSHEDLHRRELS